jgi:endonuclease III
MEYWNEPNFIAVEQGNIQKFIQKIIQKIESIENNELNLTSLNSTLNSTGLYFSKDQEIKFLNQLIIKTKSLNLLK